MIILSSILIICAQVLVICLVFKNKNHPIHKTFKKEEPK